MSPAARAPRARPVAVPLAVLLALLLVAAAVVGVRELLTTRGWASGRPWLPDLVDSLDGLTAGTAVVAVSGGVLALGVLLVVAALAPARATHVRVDGPDDLWLSPGAVAALAGASADRASGVVSAEVTRATRRRVSVEVVSQRGAAEVTDSVRAALEASLAGSTGTRFAVSATELPR